MFCIFKRKVNLRKKIDPKNGVFALNGKIDDELAYAIIKQILDYSDKYPNKTITIYINCDSGSVSSGMAIYDTISYIPNPVCTIAVEKAMGIAVLILAAGNPGMRLAYVGTRITLGQFYVMRDMQQPSQTLYSVVDKVCGKLAEHTGRNITEIKNVVDSGIIMSPKMAMKFGLIDKKKW